MYHTTTEVRNVTVAGKGEGLEKDLTRRKRLRRANNKLGRFEVRIWKRNMVNRWKWKRLITIMATMSSFIT